MCPDGVQVYNPQNKTVVTRDFATESGYDAAGAKVLQSLAPNLNRLWNAILYCNIGVVGWQAHTRGKCSGFHTMAVYLLCSRLL